MISNIVLIVSLISLVASIQLADFKEQMESKVKNLAQKMSDAYKQRCSNQILNCQIKSINQCQGTDQKICYQDFPQPPSCLSTGAYLSQNSATRFPNQVDTTQLNEQQKHFVCTSATLQTTFHDLNNNRYQRYGAAFIGTIFGSVRTFPALVDSQGGSCRDYDPRYRPWYVAAASGGKNVILILDISQSMQGQKINLVKQAAKNVINTLSNSDFIGVVTFSSDANTLLNEKIQRATFLYKQQLLKAIDGLSVYGGTNYEAAFTKAFDMLKQAQQDQFGPSCIDDENIFLFLTDGYPGQGATSLQGLIDVIDNQNSFNVKIFTYGMGSVDMRILQGLSCQYGGIMFLLEDQAKISELPKIMRSYYIYISEGIEVNKPIWTQPYDDYFGFGRLITVSTPIYYYQGSIRKILGVAGIDIPVSYLYELNLNNETDIVKYFMGNSVCYSNSLTQCQLEHLRSYQNNTCEISGCPVVDVITTCSRGITVNVFTDPPNYQTAICCGLSIANLVGIVISGIIVIHIVIGILVACYYLKYGQYAKVSDSQYEYKPPQK